MKTLRSICLPAILLMVGLVFVWYQPVFADEGEQEQVVTPEQLPPAIRKTLQRESSQGALGEVEKEIKRGRIVYEADLVLDGNTLPNTYLEIFAHYWLSDSY